MSSWTGTPLPHSVARMLRLTLAALHLLALGIGLWAVLTRGSSLRQLSGAGALQRAFNADAHWGAAALLWIGTGLWRYLGETEKNTGYYNQNHLFLTKMGLLALILALEIWPMMTLIRWRAFARSGSAAADADSGIARRIATISYVQAGLVVLMVFAAVAMARGYGVRG